MKSVKGFMTTDGTFYADAVDARLHEAVQSVKVLCDSHKPKPIPVDRLLNVLSNWSTEIMEFINANQAKTASLSTHQEDTSTVGRDQADHADGNAVDAAVVEQPAGGSEHLFEVGERPSSQGVQSGGTKHGPRGRGDDA